MYMLKRSKSERLLSALTHRATTACNVGALPSNNGVNVQRVNFNYLGATALERLGRFYNVPEAHYGCPLDELAYAVATAFMREVPFLALASLICKQVFVALFSGLLCCDAAEGRHLHDRYSHEGPLCSLLSEGAVEATYRCVAGCRGMQMSGRWR